MRAPTDGGVAAATVELIRYVNSKGARLWCENGELRFKAPKGALTSEDVRRLGTFRPHILAFLGQWDRHVEPEPPLLRRAASRVPLGFTQRLHWQARELERRAGVRQIVSVTQVLGALDLQRLRLALDALMERHEALRTRFTRGDDGAPLQVISSSGDYALTIEDVTGLVADERERAVSCRLEQFIRQPINVSTDPLLALLLVKLAEGQQVLALAMEHLICDAYSMNILLRDLWALYECGGRAPEAGLPEINIQYADYAAWQCEAANYWVARHGDYWRQHWYGAGVRFPARTATDADPIEWGRVSLRIEPQLRARLAAWCRQRRTTLVMGVFTVISILVLRWCQVDRAVIRYQSDGRFNAQIMNTIGFFAPLLNVRMSLGAHDRFLDVLSQAMSEYCAAFEHLDYGYLDTCSPPPDFVGNVAFNWVSSTAHHPLQPLAALRVTPIPFDNPLLRYYDHDGEPLFLFFDEEQAVEGHVHFPLHRFDVVNMARLQRAFYTLLESMLSTPETHVSAIQLVACEGTPERGVITSLAAP